MFAIAVYVCVCTYIFHIKRIIASDFFLKAQGKYAKANVFAIAVYICVHTYICPTTRSICR